MTPVWFHNHLTDCNCEFLHLTEDFKHAVYRNKKNGKKYTILKECVEIMTENILLCCWFLEIPKPGGSDGKMTDEEFISEMKKLGSPLTIVEHAPKNLHKLIKQKSEEEE